MRICILSNMKEEIEGTNIIHNHKLHWHRGGKNITYQPSFLTQKFSSFYGVKYELLEEYFIVSALNMILYLKMI